MRVLLAFLLGIVATIVGAYYHDTSMVRPNTPNAQLVNWDVASGLAHSATEQISTQFGRLFSH